MLEGNVASVDAVLGAGFRPTGIVELHRNEIDAGIDHLIPKGGSAVRLQAFAFDREALDGLILDLWKFVHQDKGLITRADPEGDVRITLDFSHIIKPAHLDAAMARIKENQPLG